MKELFKTPVMENNLNPVWNFSRDFELKAKKLKFIVADKDTWTADDYMGECTVDLKTSKVTIPICTPAKRSKSKSGMPTITLNIIVDSGSDSCCAGCSLM